MNRQSWDGRFDFEFGGGNVSCIVATAGAPLQITLLDAAPIAESKLLGLERASVEWTGEGAALELCRGGQSWRLTARLAFVHLPRSDAYAGLPLAQFDESAQRFWKRVFLLARLPGGRLILRLIAGRARV